MISDQLKYTLCINKLKLFFIYAYEGHHNLLLAIYNSV